MKRITLQSKVVITTAIALSVATVGMIPSILNNGNNAIIVEATSNYPEAKVIIDGKTIELDQPAIIKNGVSMVPMRALFSELGMTVAYNAKSKEVTAIKASSEGATKITIAIGSWSAYLNGELRYLTEPANTINGSLYVPLRFVSESLGAKVKWDSKKNLITITTPNEFQGNLIQYAKFSSEPITVKFGAHTYGVKSQAEYNKVMEIIKPALKDYKTNPWYKSHSMYNDEFQGGIDEYLVNGNALQFTGDTSDYFAGNWEVTQAVKPLVDNGVSAREAIELVTLHRNTASLLKNANASAKLANSSAYDGLVRDILDCGSYAYTHSAVYDTAGYNTAIIANKTHGDAFIQLKNGDWYKVTGGFTYYGKNLPSGGDLYQYSAPTY